MCDNGKIILNITITLMLVFFFALLGFQTAGQTNKDNFTLKKGANSKLEKATFGSGCFWCSEAVFERVKGVKEVESGYAGGTIKDPTYEQVCSGTTGSAEVIQIMYEQNEISYDELLEIFWKTHDPTTLNQQGNDVGTQYRSVIFYHNDEQQKKAEEYIKALDKSGSWNDPIVTSIEPYNNYSKAENYHQNYYENNPNQGYCSFVIVPKIEKFERVFKDKLKK